MRLARAQAALDRQQAAQPKQKQKHRDKHKPEADAAETARPHPSSSCPAAADALSQLDPAQRWAGGAPDLSLHWRLPHQDLHGTHHLYECWPQVSPCGLLRQRMCMCLMTHASCFSSASHSGSLHAWHHRMAFMHPHTEWPIHKFFCSKALQWYCGSKISFGPCTGFFVAAKPLPAVLSSNFFCLARSCSSS